MNEVYLLLGSNVGNRIENLKKAIGLIESECGKIKSISSVYETAAWGLKEQNNFLNEALCIYTSLTAKVLLKILKNIEKETGRTKTVKWGPRVIDIDILFYGEEIIDTPELKIPHPYLHERKFTLVPMNEIAPHFLHPVLHLTVNELMKKCVDESEVTEYLAEMN